MTWKGLEDAMKGVKEELMSKPSLVIEQAQQTVSFLLRREAQARIRELRIDISEKE